MKRYEKYEFLLLKLTLDLLELERKLRENEFFVSSKKWREKKKQEEEEREKRWKRKKGEERERRRGKKKGTQLGLPKRGEREGGLGWVGLIGDG